MTKTLMISEGQLVTADILGEFLSQFAQNKGCEVVRKASAEVTNEDISGCDVLMCVRGESPLSVELMKCARSAGKFVLYFLDDDLKDLPKTDLRFPIRRKYLLKSLAYAQGFLTSNQLLADEYLPLTDGDRSAIVETAVQPSEIQPRKARNDNEPVRLVYAGAPMHVVQWDRYLAPIWPNLAAKYGDKISMTFVGIRPDMPEQTEGARVEFVPSMKLADYRAFMYSQNFDIGLSPLQSNHFSERKYYNKFMEYAKCGICGVYSNCSPYDLVVRHEENGILTENTPEAWQVALEHIIEDHELRERCVDNAQQLLHIRFNQQRVFDQLEMDFPELVKHHTSHDVQVKISSLSKLHYKLFRLLEVMYLTVGTLRRHGIQQTWAKIKSKLNK